LSTPGLHGQATFAKEKFHVWVKVEWPFALIIIEENVSDDFITTSKVVFEVLRLHLSESRLLSRSGVILVQTTHIVSHEVLRVVSVLPAPQVLVNIIETISELFHLNWVLDSAHNNWSSSIGTNLLHNFRVIVELLDAVNRDQIQLVLLLLRVVLHLSVYSHCVVTFLSLAHEWVNEVSILGLPHVLAEEAVKDARITVLEHALTVHHIISPHADVSMTILFALSRAWPHVKSVTVLNTVNHSSSVLRVIRVHHVPFTSALVQVPVTAVTALTLRINLNSEPMSDHLHMRFQVVLHLGHVSHDQVLTHGGRAETRQR